MKEGNFEKIISEEIKKFPNKINAGLKSVKEQIMKIERIMPPEEWEK